MRVALEMRPCVKKRSGVGTYEYELSKRLQYYPDIELVGDMYNVLNRKDYRDELQGLEFRMETCTWMDYGIYRRIWNVLPIPYQMLFKRKADVTHFFNFIVPPRIEGKIINTIHDLTYRFYPETMDSNNLKRIKRDIQYSVERAEYIVTVSQNSKRDIIEEFDIDEDRVKIVYPGVDYERFSSRIEVGKLEQVKKKYHLPEQFILYMGTLEPRKNIPAIIEAFSKLKNEGTSKIAHVKLVLAGRRGWLFEEIFHKIQSLGLEDEIIFTDYVLEEDKEALYKLASVFIFPSLYEGFGIPVLEAMAASVPVIASNASSLPEVVGEAAFLVKPRDIVSMSEGMYKLLMDEAYRALLIQKGHEQAKRFNWDDSAKKLYDLYQTLK